ncbi:MAG TPA: sulfatase [Thermoanaerobaculia bacterium]|nr:sulfatase [Thermoanaerobaculia bacterium]
MKDENAERETALSRREVLAGLAAGAALAGCGVRGPRSKSRPSVLFISIDDLNDWVGVLGGHPAAVTPNLDRLAAGGRLFTRAYCSGPNCNASRSSLLTGLSPATLGCYHNRTDFRRGRSGLVTLPQHFAAGGWRTVGAGKVFHPRFNDEGSWQRYHPVPPETKPQHRPLERLSGRRDLEEGPDLERLFDFGPTEVPLESMADTQLVELARAELADPDSRPLFLGVGFTKPHLPWYLPRAFFDRVAEAVAEPPETRPDDLTDVGPLARAYVESQRVSPDLDRPEVARRAVRAYLAAIRFVDERIGHLLEAWQASRHAEGGIVVLWSDHGFHLGEKGHWRKDVVWEEATRVPLIVTAPDLPQPGVASPRAVSLLDLYPTLIELAGLAPRPGLEGLSLGPQLTDPNAGRERPAVTSWRPGSAAVRSDRYRLIRYADGFEELYDHDGDPREWLNLAREPSLAEVKRDLARWLPADGGQTDS